MVSVMEFKSFRVQSIDYSIENIDENHYPNNEEDKSSIKREGENPINLRMNLSNTNIDDEGTGRIEIEMNIDEYAQKYLYVRKIKLILAGIFHFPNMNTEYDLEELLIKNGTAILMPYIRTIISTITSFDDSTEQILLPTMNILSFFEKE